MIFLIFFCFFVVSDLYSRVELKDCFWHKFFDFFLWHVIIQGLGQILPLFLVEYMVAGQLTSQLVIGIANVDDLLALCGVNALCVHAIEFEISTINKVWVLCFKPKHIMLEHQCFDWSLGWRKVCKKLSECRDKLSFCCKISIGQTIHQLAFHILKEHFCDESSFCDGDDWRYDVKSRAKWFVLEVLFTQNLQKVLKLLVVVFKSLSIGNFMEIFVHLLELKFLKVGAVVLPD